MPTPRSHVASTTANEWLYVVGGFAGRAVPSAMAERYHLGEDRWERLPDLPVGVDHAMAAPFGGGILVVGGGYGAPTDVAVRYEVATATWRKAPRLPQVRAAGAAAAHAGGVYVVGGVGIGGELATSYVFGLSGTEWRRIADLPTPRHHLVLASTGERLCAIGGRGRTAEVGRMVECYEAIVDRWQRGPDLPEAMEDMAAVSVGRAIWVIGKSVWILEDRSWRRGPPLPAARYGLAAGALGDVVVAAGGVLVGGTEPVGHVTAIRAR